MSAANMKRERIILGEMETTFMNNFSPLMLSTSKSILLVAIICTLKLENHQLWMELSKEMKMANKRDFQ